MSELLKVKETVLHASLNCQVLVVHASRRPVPVVAKVLGRLEGAGLSSAPSSGPVFGTNAVQPFSWDKAAFLHDKNLYPSREI